MSKLIIATCDAGAGHLKAAKQADRILAITHRLVTGPVRVDGSPEFFFDNRRSIYEADELFYEPWWFGGDDVDGEKLPQKAVWSRLPGTCLEYERVELWVDPDANAQLVLLQLLDWLGQIPEIASRLWLKQAESPLGERRPGDWAFPPCAIKSADVTLASRAWSAFSAPTPEAWLALKGDPDVSRLPGLERAVEQMLGELPDRTGLGATTRRILGLVKQHEDVHSPHLSAEEGSFSPLMRRLIQSGERCPLSYFEIGQALCDLAAAPVPALSGVTERRFDNDMHDDAERFRRFRASPLSLTPLGRSIGEGGDDWARHNPILHWWGGTRLTNDILWRWDPAEGRLLAPH